MDQLTLEESDSSVEFNNRYERLNASQKEAVDTIEGPVMIIAGPGTGKTQVLALRIANILLKTQLEPENILCLTYTDAGVNAMKTRLLEVIGKSAYRVRVYTFHSFCNEVIKDHPADFPEIDRDSENMKEVEQIQILREILADLSPQSQLVNFKSPELYLSELKTIISNFKREGADPGKLRKELAKATDFKRKTEAVYLKLAELKAAAITQETFTDFFDLVSKQADSGVKLQLKNLYTDYQQNLIGDSKEDKKRRTALRKSIKKFYDTYLTEKYLQRFDEIIDVYEDYENRIRFQQKYDYDDMIMSVLRAFSSKPELLNEYQEKYQYLMVDEFQDTNSSQSYALEMLGSFFDSPNICVVGDDDQAIFRFQGASMENLLDFYNLHSKNLKQIVLTDNYRSHQIILDAAKAVIDNNLSRITNQLPNLSKTLVARSSIVSSPVKILEYKTSQEEDYGLAEKIKELTQTINAEKIAVICRKNSDLDNLAGVFAKLDIPVSINKGDNILHEIRIQQLLETIRFLCSEPENSLLFKVLSYDFWQIPSLDLLKLNFYARKHRLDLIELISDKSQFANAGIESTRIVEVVEILAGLGVNLHNLKAADFFIELINKTGFLEYMLNSHEKYVIISRLNRFYLEIKQLQEIGKITTISDLLPMLSVYEEYKIGITDKNSSSDLPAVKLMTAHSAKGLEFEQVFIYRALNSTWDKKLKYDTLKILPGIITSGLNFEEIEENRRLFYVAMTRAKSGLHISYPLSDGEKDQLPSLFVNEIPDELKEKEEVQSKQEQRHKISLNNLTVPKKAYSASGKEFVEHIVKDLRLTATHLINYLECPRCFFFKDILKIPMSQSPVMAYGTAIHNALSNLMIEYKRTGVMPAADFLLAEFQHSLYKQQLSDTDYELIHQNGQIALNEFYQFKKDAFKNDSLVEFNFGGFELFAGKVPVTGKIDRVDFMSDKTVNIVDYKTGSVTKKNELKSEKPGKYYIQLVFYKILCDLMPRLNWNVRSGTIEFIEKDKRKDKFVIETIEINETDTERIYKLIEAVYAKILKLDFEECGHDCETEWLHSLEWNI